MSLVYFSVVKTDRNTITNYDRNRKLHDIQKRELVLSICKTLREDSILIDSTSTVLDIGLLKNTKGIEGVLF